MINVLVSDFFLFFFFFNLTRKELMVFANHQLLTNEHFVQVFIFYLIGTEVEMKYENDICSQKKPNFKEY